ncbi:hypothetical protein C7H62_1389 [Mesoflavibacter sp. HG96]|uniref:hypothetical protein n=1 Tax=unclassified Mesoflavibacter TaxID=2630131 RepID=UPI000D1051F0|nr:MULTISPECIES: hypothetical protein [unclassified Mesoflavibacter]QIJ89198.1 hypothetical protein C7H62_1389 [Mesoflavibacter sp. HG96]QIJ91926.1 hypothetical protein C7H56_1389 [Mesoflavibacter sp. HG37]
MKRTILIIATVIFGILHANATTVTTNPNNETIVTMTKDGLIKVYDWYVKTTTGEFRGTSKTLFDAKKRANLVSQNEVVLEQKISNYFILKSELNKNESRLYFWEVKSLKGEAKGFSTSEVSAKKMIQLVAKGDIISYKIIASKTLK